MSEINFTFLFSYLLKIPVLLVYLVALILALGNWNKLGGAAKFAAAGFGLLTVVWLGRAAYQYWQMSLIQAGTASTEIIKGSMIFNGAAEFVELAGTVLVVVAIFIKPEKSSTEGVAVMGQPFEN